MYITAESSVYTIRADFRRISRLSLLQRAWHAVATLREHAADRAAARGMRGVSHAGVLAEYQAARRPR